MLRFIIIVLLAITASQGYAENKYRRAGETDRQGAAVASPTAIQRNAEATGQYKCDGRTYCSQMTSCAEATYFLKNCPGVKMDGDHDGIPCEDQWCGH